MLYAPHVLLLSGSNYLGYLMKRGEIRMPNNTSTSRSQALLQLITEAKQAAKKERRSETRIPFFRPVSIAMKGHCYTAFSREISESAIGLLHSMELPLDDVEISVSMKSGQRCNLLTRIEWCESCGEGWYISGGEFVDVGSTRA